LLTPATEVGYELWRSDGTPGGTNLVKDINPGPLASDIDGFSRLGNLTLFLAKDPQHGVELWKTDGTEAGTQLVKDIRPGIMGSMYYLNLLTWNNKGYFVANDGVTGDELWSTDGTEANTFLVKDIEAGLMGSFSLSTVVNAVKYPNKFIFTAYQQGLDYELWESDGTANGTKLFKEVGEGLESGIPFILPPYDVTTPGEQTLFQGNKFFFLSIMPSTGTSLWVSDGTVNGTTKIKTINPDQTDNLDYFSYIYTPKGLYFAANDGVKGNEPWKSNGTEQGTVMVADINPNGGSSEVLFTPFLVNNKLLFEGSDGDDAQYRDLFRLDEDQVVLPVKLSEFSAALKGNDGLLQWSTAQEVNSKDFVIERSYNGLQFAAAGTVPAVGFSMNKSSYNFTDRTIDFKNSTVYYRLRMNDKDGKFTHSKVIALPLDGTNDWDLKVFASSGSMQVKVTGTVYPVQLQVYDMSGRQVATSKINGSNAMATISLSSFAPGVYMIHAIHNNEHKTVQFVKH
jgi:ELWxxDGT repeat protein